MIRKLWQFISSPSSRFALGALVVVGGLMALFGVVAFEYSMQQTSTNEFCASCHEIGDNSAAEYVGTSHHTNRLGLEVACVDCHVPRAFVPKMMRKARALNEIYHHMLGTIDTPEKFEAHRMDMALYTWADMNSNDSRECRECHDQSKWELDQQSEKARKFHSTALSKGKTCIDCHKGLAHKLPEGIVEDEQLEGIDDQ